ncbi:broad-complex core protein isoforms 1/2/3/4/5-like isoform X2 [Daktulosphaira vitifoliae]|uniref:broad-complex core protein isoforms 1/2/3/4/5-like isoform X2 n=1 Tax=Daktulosphaira vitifoliae TaxID=58002 RepID=UPI0021AA28C1|nr:broad-complex core protein isoforms 1/2/3/4/5-like isoform X2 [Daktulosphaira vitifoliae]XP_050538136.1 broad-complex core protein isoforms 1/2/3/4/5-like isoform X2 [Daktulosphaira vitifoliae]
MRMPIANGPRLLIGGTVSAEARRVMGDLQHFCLRWNNYQNSITTAFENLRDDEDFIDVTLACDGKSLKAHRVVLSACSPYFKELLKSTPCKHPVIVLQDVVFDDLQALVEFIYHGEVNVHQRNLSSFLKTAEVLRVSGLTQPSETSANDHSTRQSSETPPAVTAPENSFLSPVAQNNTEGRLSPQVRQRKGIPQQSPSSVPSPRSKENSPIPLKRSKTVSSGGCMDLSERSSQHSPSSTGSRQNCNDDDDPDERSDSGGTANGSNGNNSNNDEPPMDFSRTNQNTPTLQLQDMAQNLMVPRKSPEVKAEPTEHTSANSMYADDSNDSAADFTGVHPAIGMSEPDDTSYQSHHSYLDSKFFAAAGATFNFSMAAALAADSLAGLNNHNHTNAIEALGGSTSQDWSEAGGGVGGGSAETLSCFVCGKRLSTRLTLKRHIEQQHNQPLHSAVCNVCNKVFRTLNSLNNHKSIYHRKPKAYKASLAATATAAGSGARGAGQASVSPTNGGGAAKNLPPLTAWYNNNNNINN